MTKTAGGSASNEVLKQMVSESVKGENLRNQARDMTLQGLKARELTLDQIKQVIRAVSEGVRLGAAKPAVDVSKALTDAIQGMDDALLKAVQANRLALEQFTSQSSEFTETYLKPGLDELRRLEDAFLNTMKQTAEASGSTLKAQWGDALKHTKLSGTDTGREFEQVMEEFQNRMTAAIHDTQAATVQAIETFSRNFTTLASGVLIGLSEALESKQAERTVK